MPTTTVPSAPETATPDDIAARIESGDVTTDEVCRLAEHQRELLPYTVFDIADTRSGAFISSAFGLNFLLGANGPQLVMATWFTTVYHYDVKMNTHGWIIMTPEMLMHDVGWSYDFTHKTLRSLLPPTNAPRVPGAMYLLEQFAPRKYIFRINPAFIWKGVLEKAPLSRDRKLTERESTFVAPSELSRETFRQSILRAAAGSPLRQGGARNSDI